MNGAAPSGTAPGTHRHIPDTPTDPAAPAAESPVERRSPEPASARPAGQRTSVHMVGGAHLDPVWLWRWSEGYQEARATFTSAADRMDEYPDFVFTCNQVVLLAWVEQSDPELFERIRARVAEGRWVLTGGWWVEPDCNLPTGESLVRQGLYGQRYLRSRFGITATAGLNADPFGHTATIPMILRGHGIDSYCFLRPSRAEGGPGTSLFRWRAPDGSEVLAYRIPHEYLSGADDVAPQLRGSLELVQLPDADTPAMVFYGVGNHGGGPTRANLDSITRHDADGTFGRLTLSSPRRYFDEIAGRAAQLPVWQGSLLHHARGCYSAHSPIKAWMRRAEHAVLAAERWAVMAHLATGAPHPASDLDRAWKSLLFNQFHDILPGSAIADAYLDARDQLGEAAAVADRITVASQNRLARAVPIPQFDGTLPVLVFNPHPWPVSTAVEYSYTGMEGPPAVCDADGNPVPAQQIPAPSLTADQFRGAVCFSADVPALGYRLYRLHPGSAAEAAPTGPLVVTDTSLENGKLRLVLDPRTGDPVSLLHKASGVDLLAGGAARTAATATTATTATAATTAPGARGPAGPAGAGHDGTRLAQTLIRADGSDTWGHDVVSYRGAGESLGSPTFQVLERGPVRAVIQVRREASGVELVQRYVLTTDADAVQVEAELDWQRPMHLLKLLFPVAVTDPAARIDIPYGTADLPTDGSEHPAQSWVAVTGTAPTATVPTGTAATGAETQAPAGLAVLLDGKHAVDATAPGTQLSAAPGAETPETPGVPTIGVTVVRSPPFAWHFPRGLTTDDQPDYHDIGRQRFRYQLVPFSGPIDPSDLARRSGELGLPPRVMAESAHDGAAATAGGFVEVDDPAVIVTAVKAAHDADPAGGVTAVTVRCWETGGRRRSTTIRLPLLGRNFPVTLAPNQVQTYRVPVDPAQPVAETDLVEWEAGDVH